MRTTCEATLTAKATLYVLAENLVRLDREGNAVRTGKKPAALPLSCTTDFIAPQPLRVLSGVILFIFRLRNRVATVRTTCEATLTAKATLYVLKGIQSPRIHHIDSEIDADQNRDCR